MSELTNEQLINEHRWRWNAWMKRRKQFGEMGATSDKRMIDLELEAIEREIPETDLLDGCVRSLDEV